MSQLFSSPFAPQPTDTSSQVALLCVELLSSELVFSEPQVNRNEVHEQWHQQLLERLSSSGASVERQYQNIAFIAFPHEANPVDALESAMQVVQNLHQQPLEIQHKHASLHLRYGLTLENPSQRNPMAAATERSLATAGQLVVSHLVVQVMGQKRYDFKTLEGESPIAKRGTYFVLDLNHTLPTMTEAPLSVQGFATTEVDPSPRHHTSEEDGFSDYTVELDTPFTAYQTGHQIDSNTLSSSNNTEFSVSDSEDKISSGLSSLFDALHELAEEVKESPEPPEGMSFDIFNTPATSNANPVVIDPKTSQTKEVKHSVADIVSSVPMPTAVQAPAYRPRLQLFDEAPQWPALEGVTLWISESDIHTTTYDVQSIQEIIPLFIAKGLGLYQDNYPASQRVLCLLGESGVGNTTAIMQARQQVEVFLKENEASSVSEAQANEEAEPAYLTLQASQFRHRAGHPFVLELWVEVCRAIFQIPTEGMLLDQLHPTVEGLIHYILPETEHVHATPYINTFVQFMGGVLEDNAPTLDLIESLAWLLTHIARVKPVLLQLENLDQADDASLYVLQILLQQYELANQTGLVWILQSAPSRHLAVLENLDKSLFTAVKILPFTEEQSRLYLHETWLSACFESCPDSFVQDLIRLGKGRAFYMEEALRYALQHNVLQVDGESGQVNVVDFNVLSSFKFPEDFTTIWQERLKLLPEETAKVLQLTGVLGIRFSLVSLAGLLGLEQDALNTHLGILWEQGWLVPDVADSVTFRHPDLLHCLREFIPAEELVNMHAWVYESLTQHFEAPVAMSEPLLAFHAFYAGNAEGTQHQEALWQNRIAVMTQPWLDSLNLLAPLQNPNLSVDRRIGIMRQWFHMTEDVQAEKQLLKCEAYEALQAGRISLPNEQTFEMLILLGDDAKEQLHLNDAGRLYDYALGIHREFKLEQHGDFIATINLAILAWMKYDLETLASLWQDISQYTAWAEKDKSLVPWKLEAIVLGLHVHRLQADSKGVKHWYSIAKTLWETCLHDALNPLWIARSQLAYAHYLYDKGVSNAYQQILEQVKAVLASTPTQSVVLHQTLVDYVAVSWLEDHQQGGQPSIHQRYSFLSEDIQHNADKFTPLHTLMLKAYVGSILAPQQNEERIAALQQVQLHGVAEALTWQNVELALLSRQTQEVQSALTAWQGYYPEAVMSRFVLKSWQSELVKVRLLILQNKSILAIQTLNSIWEPVASSLMGYVLISSLALLAHIHHKVAYEGGISLEKQDAYVKKSREFARQAISMAMQSQNHRLKEHAEQLMKFG